MEISQVTEYLITGPYCCAQMREAISDKRIRLNDTDSEFYEPCDLFSQSVFGRIIFDFCPYCGEAIEYPDKPDDDQEKCYNDSAKLNREFTKIIDDVPEKECCGKCVDRKKPMQI